MTETYKIGLVFQIKKLKTKQEKWINSPKPQNPREIDVDALKNGSLGLSSFWSLEPKFLWTSQQGKEDPLELTHGVWPLSRPISVVCRWAWSQLPAQLLTVEGGWSAHLVVGQLEIGWNLAVHAIYVSKHTVIIFITVRPGWGGCGAHSLKWKLIPEGSFPRRMQVWPSVLVGACVQVMLGFTVRLAELVFVGRLQSG